MSSGADVAGVSVGLTDLLLSGLGAGNVGSCFPKSDTLTVAPLPIQERIGSDSDAQSTRFPANVRPGGPGAERPLASSAHRPGRAPGRQAGPKDTILVVIELTGGNDGLNTVIPFKDPRIRQNPADASAADGADQETQRRVGLHPSLTGLAELLQGQRPVRRAGRRLSQPGPVALPLDGHLAGGQYCRNADEGWVGKALQGGCRRRLRSISRATNEPAPLALDGGPVRVPSIASLEDFQFQIAAASGADKKEQRDDNRGRGEAATGKPGLLDFVPAHGVEHLRQQPPAARRSARTTSRRRPYPNTPLANRLKLAAQLIDADLGARVFYVSLGGFDTHAAQAGQHANLMPQLSGAHDGLLQGRGGARPQAIACC